MKVYAVEPCKHAPRLSYIHSLMFHGRQIDEMADRPRFGENLSEPLRLIRNGRKIPDVFEPNVTLTLVVSERVRAVLQDFKQNAFGPVTFEKLVDFPVYAPGDRSFEEDAKFQRILGAGNAEDYENFLDKLPDVPELHNNLGRYYELIVPVIVDVEAQYRSLRTVICEMPLAYSRSATIKLSRKLVRDYPMLKSTYHIFNEEAFERISPYLDREYFGVVELEV